MIFWTRLCILAVILSLAAEASATTYTAINLGQGEACAINNNGLIAGWNGRYACTWQNGVRSSLCTVEGTTSSHALSLNSSGQIVGYAEINGNTRACLWQNNTVTLLTPLSEGAWCQAYGINDSGQIVGCSYINGNKHACLWQGDIVIDLGTCGTDTSSQAFAINNHNLIAGISGPGDGGFMFGRGCYWQDQIAHTINCLNSDDVAWWATDINDVGQIVGLENNHGWLWTNNSVTDFGDNSSANAINNCGLVAGCAKISGRGKACVWQDGNRIVIDDQDRSTNTLGINDLNQVVGWANSGSYAILWTPVPEPSSILALICGLAGLAYRRKLH